MAVSYTGVVTVTGEGRNGGRVQADDGMLDTTLAIPKELGGAGGATNPEQLFAAGYAACFQSAMHLVARGQGHDLTDSSVTAEVDLGANDAGGFGLAVRLLVSVPELDDEAARQLLEATHQVCPYSNATRGNITVDLVVE